MGSMMSVARRKGQGMRLRDSSLSSAMAVKATAVVLPVGSMS